MKWIDGIVVEKRNDNLRSYSVKIFNNNRIDDRNTIHLIHFKTQVKTSNDYDDFPTHVNPNLDLSQGRTLPNNDGKLNSNLAV